MHLPEGRADRITCRAPGEGQAPGALKGGVPGDIHARVQLAHESQLVEPPCELAILKFNIHAKSLVETKYFNLLIIMAFL